MKGIGIAERCSGMSSFYWRRNLEEAFIHASKGDFRGMCKITKNFWRQKKKYKKGKIAVHFYSGNHIGNESQ